MPRKIIQISSYCYEDFSVIVSLCNDGTVWSMVDGDEWERLKDIPQDGYVDPHDELNKQKLNYYKTLIKNDPLYHKLNCEEKEPSEIENFIEHKL